MECLGIVGGEKRDGFGNQHKRIQVLSDMNPPTQSLGCLGVLVSVSGPLRDVRPSNSSDPPRSSHSVSMTTIGLSQLQNWARSTSVNWRQPTLSPLTFLTILLANHLAEVLFLGGSVFTAGSSNSPRTAHRTTDAVARPRSRSCGLNVDNCRVQTWRSCGGAAPSVGQNQEFVHFKGFNMFQPRFGCPKHHAGTIV